MTAKLNAIYNGDTYHSNGEKDVSCFFNYTKLQNLPNLAACLYDENIQYIPENRLRKLTSGECLRSWISAGIVQIQAPEYVQISKILEYLNIMRILEMCATSFFKVSLPPKKIRPTMSTMEV